MRQMSEAHFAVLRRHMVEVIAIQAELADEELGKATLDPRVLAAMADVPRHRFVPSPLASLAYHDAPLPIGFDKTISQPFMVAVMTDLLAPLPTDSVLEVGTGLGYQTAILARLAGRVWSVEVVEELALEAEARLARLGCRQRRHPRGRRLARLGGARPLRQDPGGGRCRGGAPGAGRAAPARRPDGAAAGRRGGAGAHSPGQGRSGPARAPAAPPGALRSPGDDGMIRTVRARAESALR